MVILPKEKFARRKSGNVRRQYTTGLLQECEKWPGSWLNVGKLKMSSGSFPDCWHDSVADSGGQIEMASLTGSPVANQAAIKKLEEVVEESLRSFHKNALVPGKWHGREREMVSLYSIGYLIPQCREKGFDPTQVGIEVAVPQLKAAEGEKKRDNVCKDIVIWGEAKSTIWRRGA
jgi:hypothetical protein